MEFGGGIWELGKAFYKALSSLVSKALLLDLANLDVKSMGLSLAQRFAWAKSFMLSKSLFLSVKQGKQ